MRTNRRILIHQKMHLEDGKKFKKVPNGFWEVSTNQRDFLDWLGRHLGFTRMEDWYQVTKRDIIEHGGASLLHRFNNSPSEALKTIYCEFLWEWKKKEKGFANVQKGYWDIKENRVNLIERIGKELHVKDLDDWYRISYTQIHRVAPLTAFQKYPLEKILAEVYPNHSWDLFKLKSKRGEMKSSQRMLTVMVQKLFSHSSMYSPIRFVSSLSCS
jgi:hypothetical protein